MPALRRHRLAWLAADAWQALLQRPAWDAQARALLQQWARRDLPLVVTRQGREAAGVGEVGKFGQVGELGEAGEVNEAGGGEPTEAPETGARVEAGARIEAGDGPPLVALGLPAPLACERRRLALTVPLPALERLGDFPAARSVAALLQPPELREAWLRLCDALERLGIAARVYGSHGWQRLTGLAYLHPGSDLDLLLPVGSAAQADAACAVLGGVGFAAPRLDGELLFADGAATAWREWSAARDGRTDRLLVKRLAGASLEDAGPWLARA